MTVEQRDLIDFVGIDGSGNAVLTISDHLSWDTPNEHLFQLQEKINDYLKFIESGEVYEKCPAAQGRSFVIDIVLKHASPVTVDWFFAKASTAIEAAGFRFRVRHISG